MSGWSRVPGAFAAIQRVISRPPRRFSVLAATRVNEQVQSLSGDVSGDTFDSWKLANQLQQENQMEAIAALNQLHTHVDAHGSGLHAPQLMDLVQSDLIQHVLDLALGESSQRPSQARVLAFLSLIKLSSHSLIAQELLRLNATESLASSLRLDGIQGSTANAPNLTAATCLLLGNLALDPASSTQFAKPQVVEALLDLLQDKHQPSDGLLRIVVTCLGNMAGFQQTRSLLVEDTDSVAVLCQLLQRDDASDALRSAVAFTLGNILAGKDISAQESLRESEGLAELVLLLSPAYEADVISSAAWAIHHGVYLNHESQTLVGDAGGVGMLLGHLSGSGDQETHESVMTNVLLALESCCTSHAVNIQRLQDAEAGVLLRRLLEQEQASEPTTTSTCKQTLQKLLTCIER